MIHHINSKQCDENAGINLSLSLSAQLVRGGGDLMFTVSPGLPCLSYLVQNLMDF